MAEASAADAELRERLRRYEDRMHPHYALGFDGAKLMLQENGKPIMSWPAVSGREGTQGPEHQSYRDHGPLPRGGYRVNVSEMQRYEDLSDWDKLIAPFDRGPWAGDTPAWGRYRLWLKPNASTQTFGRDKLCDPRRMDPWICGLHRPDERNG